MYDVGGKLLSRIKSMHVDILAYVAFRIDNGVVRGFIMYHVSLIYMWTN